RVLLKFFVVLCFTSHALSFLTCTTVSTHSGEVQTLIHLIVCAFEKYPIFAFGYVMKVVRL
ncbi:hypothetical protein, partial [Leptospira weilii]|uniref:hypothetical protein n=1 Tax=Leptospira weilii TaxID=28184 RepID=UPI000B07022B